jgi:hypothetical protein
MTRENSAEDADGVDRFECPDCGSDVPVLYERHEFEPPMATGWCPKSNESKSVPVSEVKAVAE